MFITRTLTALCLLLPLAVGCRTSDAARSSGQRSAAVVAFEQRAKERGSITFRSWGGRPLRMDSDTELTFYSDGTVHMFEWGFTLMSYKGTYALRPDGRIRVAFNDFDRDWPVMVLYAQADSLLLRPENPRDAFVMGNRAGATMPGGAGQYWPFRMLVGEEESDVHEMIEERAGEPAI